MAPPRTKKVRSSTDSSSTARPQTVTLQSPARTPVQSPRKRSMTITEGQKQALIDNLQLEITERARKLRAQYALQAQSLRTRIELRINRIPTSLRNANMGELLEKYKEMSDPKRQSAPQEEEEAVEIAHSSESRPVLVSEGSNSTDMTKFRGTKRTRRVLMCDLAVPPILTSRSDAINSADKENNAQSMEAIPNPKKRAKMTTTAKSRQATNPSTVLSPKSANSRTLPQSPVHPELKSPQKLYFAHPTSPLKPISPIKLASPAKAAAAAATANLASMVTEKVKPGRPKAAAGRKASNPTTTKPAVGRPKRGAAIAKEPEDMRKVSNQSDTSSISTSTTIVKNAKKAPVAAAKNNEVGVRAVGKKVAAGTRMPPPGRRVLRKRV
ncbi:hypothetical protein HO173_005391 [Letharia columbiana]|uniref:Borealin N-terminal domain-containing protein n=1 Tax=Letharia columbiana TaxID=112416 RepID=A0A8H6FXL0_9LECA|nr:uncharacterized protein HO173_005391 [Letharia columbiana]KAF6236610.1 hypothetical protein HO173_005391 [Letharia columbiana]